MSKLRRKVPHVEVPPAKYAKLELSENPFPSEPMVNPSSSDKRINGQIYDPEIRQRELDKIRTQFLSRPQSDLSHYRIGFLADRSYVGRGNGKSAFLVHLLNAINTDYSDQISNGQNKCFALLVSPKPGGRTKTFGRFLEAIFEAMLETTIFKEALASLRLNALESTQPEECIVFENMGDEEIIERLCDQKWLSEHEFDLHEMNKSLRDDEMLRTLPRSFPLRSDGNSLIPTFTQPDDFSRYFLDEVSGQEERIKFLFNDLVVFFTAAGFNGAYVLVDDFERIPDFQSARQKKDFALELRSCLFDGPYLGARTGFYNFLIVMHAGVEAVLKEAWLTAGMEQRVSLSSGNHIIQFEKLSDEHVLALLKRYLNEYRTKKDFTDFLAPFQQDALSVLGEKSEYNAAQILRFAYDAIEYAAENDLTIVDRNTMSRILAETGTKLSVRPEKIFVTENSIDLQKKLEGTE